jgi:hypothetical protein
VGYSEVISKLSTLERGASAGKLTLVLVEELVLVLARCFCCWCRAGAGRDLSVSQQHRPLVPSNVA